MEEKAIKGRKEVWFNPPKPDTTHLKTIISKITNEDDKRTTVNKRIKGTSFCHVLKIIHIGQDKRDITAGYHRWLGGKPNFTNKPNKSGRNDIFIIQLGVENKINLNKINPEPKTWAKKYFILASADGIKGINDKRFNSKPNHTINQLEEVKEIIVPRINLRENREWCGSINI